MRPHVSAPARAFEHSSRLPSTSAQDAEIQSLFKQQFRALSADKQRFHEVMRASFGEGYDVRKAEQYRQRARADDFTWLPRVSWVAPEILEGARGAYYAEFDTVFLSHMLQRFPALAAATFVEEAGHLLESQLNPVDLPDNRGRLFRRILGGEGLTQVRM